MENCLDRNQLDRVVTQVEDNTNCIEIDFSNEQAFGNDENWDTNAPCYHPEEYCQGKMILRRLDIASKAIFFFFFIYMFFYILIIRLTMVK
jgi:hypothetical protein